MSNGGGATRLVVTKERVGPNGTSKGAGGVEPKSKLDELFERLGANGKIKVYRVVAGEDRYTGTLQVDADLSEHLEERIAALYGGGSYALKGFVGGDCVKCATLYVDPNTFPPKASDAEARRGEPPAGSSPTLADVQRVADEAASRARAEERERVGQLTATFNLLLTMQQQSFDRTIAILQATQGKPIDTTATPVKSGLEQVRELAAAAEALGFSKPGAAGATPGIPYGDLPPGLRLLAGPIEKVGDKIGDRIGDAIAAKWFGGGSSPAPSASAPSPTAPSLPTPSLPAAATPATTGATPPATPSPASQPLKSIPGAVAISPERAKQLIEQAQRRPRRTPSTPAPPAKDVTPTK